MIYLRRVVGDSMLPAYRPNRLVVFMRRRSLRPGDIVLISHEGLEKIKRVKELSGRKVYVTGDNLASSTDSRHFGWLPRASIKARLIFPR